MTIDLDALEKLDMPGMHVWLVETAPYIPASPSFAIRKWDNDGLEGGTHQLVAEPVARTEINRLRAELKEARGLLAILDDHLGDDDGMWSNDSSISTEWIGSNGIRRTLSFGLFRRIRAFLARNGKGEG